jgi:uncharacterized protein with beta-barrel porin domain
LNKPGVNAALAGAEQEMGISSNKTVNQRLFPHSKMGLWSAGAIEYGSVDLADNQARFNTTGITIGADKQFSSKLIAGIALGYGKDSTRLDTQGSKTVTRQMTYSIYTIYQPLDRLFFDLMMGYSRNLYTSNRWAQMDSTLLSGDRTGDLGFASLGLSRTFDFEELQLSPFIRGDYLFLKLHGYTETGSDLSALTYNSANMHTEKTIGGLVAAKPISLEKGVLTPSVKLQVSHNSNTSLSQTMYYSDLGSTSTNYTLITQPIPQNIRALGLALNFANLKGLTMSLGWLGSLGSEDYRASTFSGDVTYLF